MAIKSKQFNSHQELTDYLNDIVLTKNLSMPFRNLDGLTVILDSNTVTFADASGEGLSPAAIVTQINAVVAGAAVLRNYGHAQSPGPQVQVALVKPTMVIDKDGTANALLGLPTAADKTVGSAAVAKANIIDITSDGQGSRYTVWHE